MANNNEMEITLSLNDQASGQAKKAIGSVNDETKKFEKQSHESLVKTNESWTRLALNVGSVIKAYNLLSRGVQDVIKVGRDMDSGFNRSFDNFEESILRVQQTIALKLIPVLKTSLDFWSEFLNKKFTSEGISGLNDQLSQSENKLKDLKKELSNINLGNFVQNRFNIEKMDEQKKALEGEIKLEEARVETIKKLMSTQQDQTQKQFEQNLSLREATNAVTEHVKELKDAQLLFITGKNDASQYYQTIYDGANSVIEINQEAAKQLKELADATALANNQELQDARNRTQEQVQLLNYQMDVHRTATQGMAALTVQFGKSIQQNLSGALTDFILGAKTAKEAFIDLGKSLIKVVLDFVIQKVIAAALEKTLLAGTVASSVAAGAAVAAAWAPAAAMVSLATFGGNAAPAAAGIASVTALSTTLAAVSQVTSHSLGAGNAIPRATGGDDIVTKPTLFLAGEAGPERATFTPLNGGGSSGRGGLGSTIQIIIQHVDMTTNQKVQEVAEMLGFEFERIARAAR